MGSRMSSGSGCVGFHPVALWESTFRFHPGPDHRPSRPCGGQGGSGPEMQPDGVSHTGLDGGQPLDAERPPVALEHGRPFSSGVPLTDHGMAGSPLGVGCGAPILVVPVKALPAGVLVFGDQHTAPAGVPAFRPVRFGQAFPTPEDVPAMRPAFRPHWMGLLSRAYRGSRQIRPSWGGHLTAT